MISNATASLDRRSQDDPQGVRRVAPDRWPFVRKRLDQRARQLVRHAAKARRGTAPPRTQRRRCRSSACLAAARRRRSRLRRRLHGCRARRRREGGRAAEASPARRARAAPATPAVEPLSTDWRCPVRLAVARRRGRLIRGHGAAHPGALKASATSDAAASRHQRRARMIRGRTMLPAPSCAGIRTAPSRRR